MGRLHYCALLLSFALLAGTGCAMTTAIPVHPDDKFTWGLRVYDSKPLLFVTKTGWNVVFVPNYSKAYAVRFDAFLAKNKSKVRLDNGTLSGDVEVDLDSTTIIPYLQNIAKQVLPGGGQGGNITETGELIAVYEFVFDEQGNYTHLHKLSPDDPTIALARKRRAA
jgi:hypothetical protein